MPTIGLFIVLIFPGHAPVVQSVDMPDLGTCIEQVELVLTRAVDTAGKGVTVQAACSVAMPQRDANGG